MNRVSLLDLKAEVELLWDEINAAIQEVLRSGVFIMGPNVKALEQEIARYLGVKHAVALNSGTDALILGIHALGIKPGDEVITTPFTFFATAEAISHFKAVPVFVDIDPRTFNLNVEQVLAKITPRTKAIIPVHLYGHAADMGQIMEIAREFGLRVLEDVAQAFGGEYKGRKLGSIGDAGALSFFPSKNLGAFGDGGMLVTNDDTIADTVRILRVHGARKKYYNERVGVNSRLDEIQAAILRVKIHHIDEWNRKRREAAAYYNELLRGVPDIELPYEAPYAYHVYHQYTIRVHNNRRDWLQARLREVGIDTAIYYPVPLHLLPIYQDISIRLPQAELASREVLSLPMGHTLNLSHQQRVAEAINAFMNS
ncbi:MAG: aminotransferase [Fimbriimonadales bacterium]|nr:MAG: aminotransferase [Fimbriimonadales bacterium]GIW61030.1 MAG: aminotransferase [Patescibacteria group bacterium]